MMEIERNRSPQPDSFFDLFDRHADRSSHLVGLYPGLQASRTTYFAASFHETANSRVFANEPICAKNKKAETIVALATQARDQDKNLILFPCSLPVARELRDAHSYATLMIGVEAVFNLKNYFDDSVIDPLDAIPAARLWKKRGARIETVAGVDLTAEQRLQIGYLTDRWKKLKNGPKLGFLNRTEPLLFSEKKRYCFMRWGEEIVAFLALIPVPSQNGYYAADYIRNPDSRAGAVEFLLIESMRALRAEKVTEIRMGLSPLARLHENPMTSQADNRFGGMLRKLFRDSKTPYSFASIYEFKQKLEPTRWEPLYLVTPKQVTLRTFWECLAAIFEKSPLSALLENKFKSIEAMFSQQFTARAQSVVEPKLDFGLGKASLILAVLCVGLHFLKLETETFSNLYRNYGFHAENFNFLGWLVGPFFHNTEKHLWGDLLSLVFFGYFFEVFFGLKRTLPIIAIGLWASNPLTVGFVAPVLSVLHPHALQHLLTESDYGSSNAVYALVGAWAATLRRPSIIVVPFLFNGLVVCYRNESILALHHWFALFAGMIYFKLAITRRLKPALFQ